MKLRTAFPAAAVAIAIVLFVGAYRDTASALAAINAPLLKQESAQQASLLKADMGRFAACEKYHDEKDAFTAAGRDCLIEGMKETESEMGGVAFALASTSWLKDHPDDDAVRTAALVAIDKGRAALVRQAGYYHDWDLAFEAHDASALLSLMDGKQAGTSKFTIMADALDKAQYMVMLPGVAKDQREWRLKASKAISG